MFGCYGTLIDWESGLLTVLQPFLKAHEVYLTDQKVLDLYGGFESEAQRDRFNIYQEILRNIIRSFGNKFSFIPSTTEINSLVNSIGKWKPFPDTVKALQTFKEKYKLAVIANIDDSLFALTETSLQTNFDWVITSQQVGAYKPSKKNYEYALHEINHPKDFCLSHSTSPYCLTRCFPTTKQISAVSTPNASMRISSIVRTSGGF